MTSGDILSVAGAAFGLLGALVAAILKYAIDKRDREIDRRIEDERSTRIAAIAEAKKTDDEAAKKATEETAKLREDVHNLVLRASDDARAFERKLHEAEIARVKLEGKVELLSKTYEAIERDLDEIKNRMVSRQEWEERMDRFESSILKLEGKLDVYARASRWSPPSGIPATRPPLPREEEEMGPYKRERR